MWSSVGWHGARESLQLGALVVASLRMGLVLAQVVTALQESGRESPTWAGEQQAMRTNVWRHSHHGFYLLRGPVVANRGKGLLLLQAGTAT